MHPVSKAADSGKARRLPTRTTLYCALPALAVSTFCLLPFLNKPFVIDDPHFLAMARQILKAPLHPMNFDICWNIVTYCAKAFELTPGNTLMGYALVPTVLAGGAEWIAHTTQLIFVWIAVVTMSSLALRLGWSKRDALVASLLLVAIPPLLPMASTAMPDVLALAVGLVGMERLAAWKDERKWYQGAVAAIALGLAGVARAHLALLLPLGAFFLLDSSDLRRILSQIRQSFWLWSPILAGGFILLSAIYATRERSVLLDPPSLFTGIDNIGPNLRSYLLYLCFPLPLSFFWAAARWMSAPRRVALIMIAAVATALVAGSKLLFLDVIAGCALADMLSQAWMNRDQRGLFLLLWVLVPLPVVYYGHLPIKYLLPCMPAVILLCLRLGSALPERVFRTLTVLFILGGIGYSGLILQADAEFARFGRDALTRLIRPRVLAGEKVWFPNQAWSYWYAPLAGAELMIPGIRQPNPGDFLVVGIAEAGDIDILERFPKRRLVQALAIHHRFGRTMESGVGLYSNRIGNWLWKPGSSPNERYELWRID